MAKLNGFNGSVTINSNTIAEVEEWSTNDSAQMFTASSKGESRVTGAAGPVTTKLTMTMFTDRTDTTGQGAIVVGATLSSFELYLDGNSTGDYYYTCTSGVVESVDITDPMDYSKKTCTVHLNNPLVEATVA